MKRTMILAGFFAAFIAMNSVSAQDGKNTISVGIANLSGSIEYERQLNTYVSFGVEAIGGFSFEINTYDKTSWFKGSVSAEGELKIYPMQGMFFAKLGAGYQWEWLENKRNGFFVNPGAGWKIDVGKPDGFVLTPAISIPVSFYGKRNTDSNTPFGIGVLVKLALGYVF